MMEYTPIRTHRAVRTTTITMRQARLYLHQKGMLEQVDALIGTLDKVAQIEWEYAATLEISSSLVQGVADLLELTEDQKQDMFDEASKL